MLKNEIVYFFERPFQTAVLASLKVTLVCNYDPPIKQLNGAESIATRVAKKHQELIINYQLPWWYITIYSNILV